MLFELVVFNILAFVFGALWGYYTGASKWRNKYYALKDTGGDKSARIEELEKVLCMVEWHSADLPPFVWALLKVAMENGGRRGE